MARYLLTVALFVGCKANPVQSTQPPTRTPIAHSKAEPRAYIAPAEPLVAESDREPKDMIVTICFFPYSDSALRTNGFSMALEKSGRAVEYVALLSIDPVRIPNCGTASLGMHTDEARFRLYTVSLESNRPPPSPSQGEMRIYPENSNQLENFIVPDWHPEYGYGFELNTL